MGNIYKCAQCSSIVAMSTQNLQKFNQIHPKSTDEIPSRPGTAGNDLFTESSKLEEIVDIYNRPSTAGKKVDQINFLGKILSRGATPNSNRVEPLQEENLNENSDEGFKEEKENETNETTESPVVLHGHGESIVQDHGPTSRKHTQIDPQDSDDVLYLVTHENKQYIQLNTARNHVLTLIEEIQKLRTRHTQQVKILRSKLVNTAAFAKSLQDRPKTPTHKVEDLSGEVGDLKREITTIQLSAQNKEKKLKKKIKELSHILESLRGQLPEEKFNEIVNDARAEAKASGKAPAPLTGEGMPKRSKSFVREPGVDDILELDEEGGEGFETRKDRDPSEIQQPSTSTFNFSEMSPDNDREGELLRMLQLEQTKVKDLEEQLKSQAEILDDTIDGEADDQAEITETAGAPEMPSKGNKLTKTFAKLTATSGATLSVGDQKKLKQIQKKLEMETKKFQREKDNAEKAQKELAELSKELKYANKQIEKLENELKSLGSAAVEGRNAIIKAKELEQEIGEIKKSNATLEESFVKERKLRRQYYNELEDMKGKIRVFARVRPMARYEKERQCEQAVFQEDEMTVKVKTNRFGTKEFTFNRVFMPEDSQEEVFEDTNRLIQSAIDGFNVCIFAYGQTGSGKTYTMIGEKPDKLGLAPRAFERCFELLEENKKKFTYKVKMYMLELYCDKLRDLLAPKGKEDANMEIKKDKAGMVYVQGATIIDVANATDLEAVFDAGNSTRKVSKTKMNDASSRSHLVVSLLMESVNRETGNVISGKLSLVDLAGSERVAKTGANPQQIKEANSINQSLSALGNVIAGLVEGEKFIRYRDNKLTQLMQDSLGGNAKTLMFVNVSPADYNADETSNSLVYANRVKHITNDAQKNAESQEVARLKDIIGRLKGGEDVSNDEVNYGK